VDGGHTPQLSLSGWCRNGCPPRDRSENNAISGFSAHACMYLLKRTLSEMKHRNYCSSIAAIAFPALSLLSLSMA
jgi:hypothetical protein